MKYSIITCVYNAEEYVDEYLQNIDSVNYEDYEIIVVDDYSHDNTKNIFMKKKQSKHPLNYIRLEKNVGPGIARNKGINIASGDYIIFVDIDDKIDKEIFNTLDQYEDYDIVYFDYFTFSQNKILSKKHSVVNIHVDIQSLYDLMKRISGCVWGKRFKKSIINKNRILFPNLYKSEDIVFLMRYILKCESFAYCEDKLYKYRISLNSLMHRNIDNQIKYAYSAMKLLKQEVLMPEDVYNVLYMKEIVYDLSNVYVKIGRTKNELDTFWNKEKLDWKVMNERNCFSIKQKIILFLIKFRLYYVLKLINIFR